MIRWLCIHLHQESSFIYGLVLSRNCGTIFLTFMCSHWERKTHLVPSPECLADSVDIVMSHSFLQIIHSVKRNTKEGMQRLSQFYGNCKKLTMRLVTNDNARGTYNGHLLFVTVGNIKTPLWHNFLTEETLIMLLGHFLKQQNTNWLETHH